VTDGRRRWARITTSSSAILLLVAVISLWQVSGEFFDSYNPESNYLVKLDPGESGDFEIVDSALLTALRVSEGGTPDSDLTLTDSEGNEIPGRNPRWKDPERMGSDGETVYSPVRVFKGMEGSFTLQNQGSSGLWLVNDDDAAEKMLGNVWMYMFYIGCCIGSPIGLVGVVLAVMVWADKRKVPDQFVIIEDGSVIIGNPQQEGAVVEEPGVAPSPFVGVSNQTVENPQEEEFDDYWKKWDEG